MTGFGRLTTHVLDTANGHPARGMTIDLYRVDGDEAKFEKSVITNDDGRCDAPLLEGEALAPGAYRLCFHAGDYFSRVSGLPVEFLDVIPVDFRVGDATRHYHVPLLASPFGYSTYRGS
ncbi:hydroxyisourate hydrolase [Pelagibacterium luteolum]|uniref:5-hydroxyisourate hydrolase n=1 Tax=Pelagibacterium luteolum TaxID=440168 RepID=A0A1G7UVJ5_9HYPH|nr:hydroxyisourate hydrolase [Pelagibacterium luteolum]SDG51149.1 5-hydroxyisourate hydrolase [Pelagibacterium luteolum]